MLWRDFNRALEEEGGVFGRPPTANEVERIRREKLKDPDTLVSEPWARRGQRRTMSQRPASKRAGETHGDTANRPTGSGPAAGTPGGAPRFRTNPRRGGEGGGGFR
jgi:hypothetical protein